MDEIAKLAGVSKATVSRVLNDSECGVGEQTRVRVKKIAEELGYSVEQTEKKKKGSKSGKGGSWDDIEFL